MVSSQKLSPVVGQAPGLLHKLSGGVQVLQVQQDELVGVLHVADEPHLLEDVALGADQVHLDLVVLLQESREGRMLEIGN